MKNTFFVILVLFLGVSAVMADTSKTGNDTVSQGGTDETNGSFFNLLDLKMSDVLISSRTKHPTNKKDRYNTSSAIESFHATRMEWTYSFDAEFIKDCRKHGIRRFQGTVNTIYQTGKKYSEKAVPGHLTNQNGKPVTATWMQVIYAWWGCVNSNEYRKDYAKRLEQMLDNGIDSIHMDDPGLNVTAISWGACFCPYCYNGFKKWLANHTQTVTPKGETAGKADILTYEQFLDSKYMNSLQREYREFQKESVICFYADMRKIINRKAGYKVPFSSNNYGGRHTFPYNLFDFGSSEFSLEHANPNGLLSIIRAARKQNQCQFLTLALRNIALNRACYSAVYAAGGHMILPWDVYIPPTLSPRLFAEPEEFADLSGFVRAMSPYLDDYTDLPEAQGFSFEHETIPGLKIIGTSPTAAFLRKSVRRSELVLHLVDWSAVPNHPEKADRNAIAPVKKNSLVLNFNPGRTIQKITVWTPAPYNRQLHQQAEISKNCQTLAVPQTVNFQKTQTGIQFPLPVPTPWTIVVFE